ncbi:hypothetical protein EDI_306210 [Entamoeba dispar SAW760]|uniref:Uncharacterized protein n=1 Tax=Entamoeba dispar (strain ATCC PRA-260 / SAW760) TaxID=370354 RepID=B0EMK6_ENTDS|nr:uncharacterized protein EDI_306210 [Entamoeba dispar SAW760]EDR24252.1 hypothetical protein EDI_306210 [Entamoeba dispar SAW760]|eukprot:EDR24252.1 hypothetical protein EDI_306210 [Entamoeba dispar SAW760]
MNPTNNICNCYKCVCGNVSISVKSVGEQTDLALNSVPLNWVNPIYTTTGVIQIKYQQLKNISTNSKLKPFSLIHCNLCNTDVCCYIPRSSYLTETYVIINPSLRNIKDLREDMIYSKAYDLYINNFEIQDNISWCCNDPIERTLYQKSQDYIDALFEEKERKVREFVLKQEEIFEEQRREARNQYLMLKKQCSERHIISSSSTFNSSTPTKTQSGSELKQNHLPFYLLQNCHSKDGIFFFDEESESGVEPSSYEEKASLDNRVFSRTFHSPSNLDDNDDVPVFAKKQEKKLFPTTFKEFTLEKVQQESYEKPSCISTNLIKQGLI